MKPEPPLSPFSESLASAYAECSALVRAGDYDRWIATRFAPAAAQPHLDALHAFSLEIARVREIVSEPLIGEVRHQYWRDRLAQGGTGEGEGNQVAAALLDTIARFRLPVPALVALVEARSFDLYDDPMPTLVDLEGYCGETASSLMRLASLVLAGGREAGKDPGGADAVGHAGVAYAMTGLLRALPWHTSRGQVYLPADLLARHGLDREAIVARRDGPPLRAALAEMRAIVRRHLAAAREALPGLAPEARPAVLGMALVEPYLKAMERRDYDPFRTVVEVPSWRRLVALWRFSRRL